MCVEVVTISCSRVYYSPGRTNNHGPAIALVIASTDLAAVVKAMPHILTINIENKTSGTWITGVICLITWCAHDLCCLAARVIRDRTAPGPDAVPTLRMSFRRWENRVRVHELLKG
jgi:hypothetical protein